VEYGIFFVWLKEYKKVLRGEGVKAVIPAFIGNDNV
jgi:hypothetical protein